MQARRFYYLVMFIIFLAPSALSAPFSPLEIPKGAKVTIAQPAITHVPLGMLVHFGSTDRAQALRLKAVSRGSRKAMPLTIYIYDKAEKTQKVVTLYPNTPLFYHFKSLGTIRIRPELSQSSIKPTNHVFLEVESNRPATIYH